MILPLALALSLIADPPASVTSGSLSVIARQFGGGHIELEFAGAVSADYAKGRLMSFIAAEVEDMGGRVDFEPCQFWVDFYQFTDRRYRLEYHRLRPARGRP